MNKYILIALTLFVIPVVLFAQTTTTDYKAVGETWMQKMMGDEYAKSNQYVEQIMGSDFLNKAKEATGRALESKRGYVMMPASSDYTQGCQWTREDKEGLKNIIMKMGDSKASWFGGIIGGAIVGAGVVFALLAIAIPVAILVLLIVLIVKSIRSLSKK